MNLETTITCPNCGFTQTERMPQDSCQYFWECTSCGKVTQPKKGDCCVYCSYADTPCPPIQQSQA